MNTNLKQKMSRDCARLIASFLLTAAASLPLCAQTAVFFKAGSPPPGGAPAFTAGGGGGGFGLVINGFDIGTILLKAADSDQDGQVTAPELKTAIATYFKQWDTNADGSLNADEFSAALKKLFPAPPPGAQTCVAVVNGVQVEIPPDQIPTPDKQVAKHIFAASDSDQDGLLSLSKVNDWVDKTFGQWDQNSDGMLNASELNTVFGQLARPD